MYGQTGIFAGSRGCSLPRAFRPVSVQKPPDPTLRMEPSDQNQEMNQQDRTGSLMESPTKPSDTATSANPTDDAFGLTFGALTGEDSHPQLDGQWRRGLGAHSSFPAEEGEKPQTEAEKTAEQRLAEPSGTAGEHASLMPTDSAKEDDKATEISPQPVSQEPIQATQKTPTEMPRKSKPAITINTGLTGVGSKRPPPTPVLPPTFSWNDILRVQNLIERCLQQYLTKNEILVTLREQANVDPAFANVVWQKLEEQNPTFFRAYSIQLQLKEQIIAFNYLVGQQKEMAAKGGKRLLNYSGMSRAPAARVPTSYSLGATPTTTTLPPINMDSRTLLRTPIRSVKHQRTPADRRAYSQQHMNSYQLSNASANFGTTAGMTTLPPPSPLPLPSPIKTDLDTHAFFT